MPNQKENPFHENTFGKGTRSKYETCYKKGCDYEKLRHINNMVKKTKEREDCIMTKHYKKKLHEEMIKKLRTIYPIINQTFYSRIITYELLFIFVLDI